MDPKVCRFRVVICALWLSQACVAAQRLMLYEDGKKVQDVSDGDKITFNKNTMTMVADFDSPGGRRVIFYNRRERIFTDSDKPYSMFGEKANGDFKTGALPEGAVRIRAVKDISDSQKERITRDVTIKYPSPAAGNRLYFVNPKNGRDLKRIATAGGTTALTFDGPLSVRAEFVREGDYVIFRINGKTVRRESREPYALYGDSGGKFAGQVFAPGTYTIIADLFRANGQRIYRVTGKFRIVAPPKPAPNPTPKPAPAPAPAPGTPCNLRPTFKEVNGLVVIEAESFPYQCAGNNWAFTPSAQAGATVAGSGYITYTGPNRFSSPGASISSEIIVAVDIQAAGTYKVFWHNLLFGSDQTEHNDAWLKIYGGNTEFYAAKTNSASARRIYPRGGFKSGPYPFGSSGDGFFKIYRNGPVSEWSWATRTSDHDAHSIYVNFSGAGTYFIAIRGRSSKHSIDRLVMQRIRPSEPTKEAQAKLLSQAETRA